MSKAFRQLRVEGATKAEIVALTATFTSEVFEVDKRLTIAITGLTSDTVQLEFSADDGASFEEAGLAFDSTNKIETLFGPCKYRLVKGAGTNSLTVGLYAGSN